MTPDDYRALQHAMRMDARTFAEWLCATERNGRRWAAGTQDIPRWIQVFGPFLVEAATGQWGPDVRHRVLRLPRDDIQPAAPWELRRKRTPGDGAPT